MKKTIAAILCFLLLFAFAACGQSDLPDVSIPTDEELSELIGEYSSGLQSDGVSEEVNSSNAQTSGASQSYGGESGPQSGEASRGNESRELTPNIYGQNGSSAASAPLQSGASPSGQSSSDTDEGHSITTVITPFLVSDDVIAAGKKNGNPPNPRPTELICTISVSCSTAVSGGLNKKAGFTHLPSDGWILSPVTVSYSEGEKVFDVLARVLKDEGIQMEYSGAGGLQYIKGIDNLYEFDAGRWSGWMYCVNDWYPNFGCGQYTIDPGDTIEWNYTCDLGSDLGQTWMGG